LAARAWSASVVHLVVAYLAVQIALGSGQQAADQRGAPHPSAR
jgi:hypothetical protein